MRALLLLAAFIAFCTIGQAQSLYEQVQQSKQTGQPTSTYSPFAESQARINVDNFKDGQAVMPLTLLPETLQQIQSLSLPFLSLSIPSTTGKPLALELFEVVIFTPDVRIKELSSQGEREIKMSKGSYYRGVVKGDPKSLVAVSIVQGEVSGIIADSTGTRVLGRYKDSNASPNDYILYNDSNLTEKPDFACDAIALSNQINTSAEDPQNTCATGIGIYFETDLSMFNRFGSTAGVQNYVAALFNQVATMYTNESINILISGLNIWTTADPYQSATNTSTALSLFKNRWNGMSNNFPGQLAHLLSTRSLGGGIAYVDVLCGIKQFAYGVSGIYGSFQQYPTYSWDVMVITHELGHNFGSPHTQSCSWAGGAIDNCYTTEGGCPPGPAPTNGGTVMSYCHLTSNGINLANGFGPLPGSLIRSRYSAASSCRTNPSTAAPTALSTTQVTDTKATLNWTRPTNYFSTYTVQYRLSGSTGSWTEVNTAATSYTLNGLTQSTGYTWQVKTVCSGYSSQAVFTTSNPISPYCTPASNCSTGNGLNAFVLYGQQLSSNSGCSPNGYKFFDSAIVPKLVSGSSYPFSAELSSTSSPQYIKIWIDYNQDNVFAENEVAYSSTQAFTGSFTGTINVAQNINPLTTRMRIRTKYNTPNGTACEVYALGETEDYLVEIQGTAPYCEPTADCTDTDGLSAFIFNGQTLSNNSGCSPNGYSYFSNAPVAQLSPGSSYVFTGTILSSVFPEHVTIWIDYNKDNIFSENEMVFTTISSIAGSVTGSINVATNIPAGSTRMRVRVRYLQPITNPCETYTWGETEDYPVQINVLPIACESVASGSWASAATWTCGRVPLITDAVTIKPGHVITLNTLANAKSIVLQNSASLQYLAGGQLNLN